MARQRLAMHKIRDILRKKWVLRLSHRQIARSLGISAGGVGTTVSRAVRMGLDWDAVQQLTDEELERRLYGPKLSTRHDRPLPDFVHIHIEMKRRGVTLELLHVEYLEKHPHDGYRYSRFCDLYRKWCRRRKLSMRHNHRAGEKTFIDYSGDKAHFIDSEKRERVECELFVAVLGASSYTFIEATRSQQSSDFIESHVRAFEFFGGVTCLLVPDQLRSGVSQPCRYEPGIQRTYAELAEHYGSAVLPARQRKPKDKAKVESAVLLAQRWVLARIRDETFFSLDELNARLRELTVELNDRPMQHYGKSRRELYEQLDQPVLLPLPRRKFIYGAWEKVSVRNDYHVRLDHHFYSVPHALVGAILDARLTTTTVELFCKGQRVGVHRRSAQHGRHTTQPEHMPQEHREHLQWSPEKLRDWATSIGPQTLALVSALLESCRHPEQGYRSCLGLMRLCRRYDPDRLEAACARAMAVGARSYRHVESILKNGLDRLPPIGTEAVTTPSAPLHENVRGGDYYH